MGGSNELALDPQLQIHNIFHSSCCFEQSGIQLNMDQSDSINNRMVKSCCVVSKQVEVSTVLASVESTGSWLHADTSLVFMVLALHC